MSVYDGWRYDEQIERLRILSNKEVKTPQEAREYKTLLKIWENEQEGINHQQWIREQQNTI